MRRTGYFHVPTLTVDDGESFLTEVGGKAVQEKPAALNVLSHIIPAQRTFNFTNAEEFEARARDIAILWAPRVAGMSFHVRLHRRGFKGGLATPKEERFLAEALLDAMAGAADATPARVAQARTSPSS
jgi:hypothetical protein